MIFYYLLSSPMEKSLEFDYNFDIYTRRHKNTTTKMSKFVIIVIGNVITDRTAVANFFPEFHWYT